MRHFFSQAALRIIVVILFYLSLQIVSAKAPLLSKEDLVIHPPRIIRTCCSFGSEMGYAGIPFVKRTDITDISSLGTHAYMGNENEGNGIIYTKKGGFIDIAHLRDCADWTAYLFNLISLSQENSGNNLKELGNEGGLKTLALSIPANLNYEDACELAAKIAYDLSLWHEIATWYGASYIPLIPERYSSFSPEDLYSNLLGVTIAIQAIQSDLGYNEAMTLLIDKTLNTLKAVSTLEETYQAMNIVDEIWWTNSKNLPSKKVLLKRYVESDSYLVPWLLPDEANTYQAYKLNKPGNGLEDLYELKIKLNYKFPVKSFWFLSSDGTITQNDFDFLLKEIGKDFSDSSLKLADRSKRTEKRKN